jgi:hypothetical protein
VPSNHGHSPSKKGEDVVWVHSQTPDGEGLNVVRKRGDEVSFGQVRRVVEGKPILGELVALRPREDAPRFFDVEVLHAGTTTGREGPPQVSTPAYRHGWAEVFGPKKKRAASSALN